MPGVEPERLLTEGQMDWGRLRQATGLNLPHLGLGAWLTAAIFRVALRRGLLPEVR